MGGACLQSCGSLSSCTAFQRTYDSSAGPAPPCANDGAWPFNICTLKFDSNPTSTYTYRCSGMFTMAKSQLCRRISIYHAIVLFWSKQLQFKIRLSTTFGAMLRGSRFHLIICSCIRINIRTLRRLINVMSDTCTDPPSKCFWAQTVPVYRVQLQRTSNDVCEACRVILGLAWLHSGADGRNWVSGLLLSRLSGEQNPEPPSQPPRITGAIG